MPRERRARPERCGWAPRDGLRWRTAGRRHGGRGVLHSDGDGMHAGEKRECPGAPFPNYGCESNTSASCKVCCWRIRKMYCQPRIQGTDRSLIPAVNRSRRDFASNIHNAEEPLSCGQVQHTTASGRLPVIRMVGSCGPLAHPVDCGSGLILIDRSLKFLTRLPVSCHKPAPSCASRVDPSTSVNL